MIYPTGTNALVSVIQVIVASDEHGNVQFFQDGLALGAFTIAEPDTLLAVLRHGGAVSGFNAFNAIVPSTKSAVVLLCNKDGGLGSLPETLMALLLKEESNIPKVTGLPASDAAKNLFLELQGGTVDRTHFGDEFNLYLTETKILAAAERLKFLGAPKIAELLRTRERGGMEVTTTRLTFETRKLETLMYRTPAGKIEQFFVDEN